MTFHFGWKPSIVGTQQTGISPLEIMDGIRIYTWGNPEAEMATRVGNAPVPEEFRATPEEIRAWVIGEKLETYFDAFDLKEDAHWPLKSFAKMNPTFRPPPVNTILVLVGLKPIWGEIMQNPDLWKDMSERINQLKEQSPPPPSGWAPGPWKKQP